ncbi:hypothetical protein G7047_17255 [Diaphorobacter sp. HDW4A]|uniref:hypothetical protein n=1 Tax=Diaphorobacter sp. HDW4A TaxID=2714924 RepID=UPI00140D5095|nr:hypothetical protein [Diaphorobacter sp. HDW4A]QIL81464.1 hypothetical protein G7047_17255 [Diaphorobacter sp. HDW4A]
MIFNAALHMDIELRAAPPRTTRVKKMRFILGEGLVKVLGDLPWTWAILYPQSIAEIWQTGESEVTHATGTLKNDDEFLWFEDPVIVRTDDVRVPLAALEAMANADEGTADSDSQLQDEKPLQTKERNTLLCIIAALCKESKIPYSNASKAAGLIVSTAAQLGISLGETTVEGHLKKIPDALASRMK